MDKIDKLDQKILNIVTRNARIPSKDVALECGVSRAAIHQHLQRLQEMKVITGSAYIVDPRALGYSTCAYIGVKLGKCSLYQDAVRELVKIPEIVECHYTTGPYALLIKVYAHDTRHLMNLLNEKILPVEGVTETETLISLEQSIFRQIQIQTDGQ